MKEEPVALDVLDAVKRVVDVTVPKPSFQRDGRAAEML